MKPLESQVIALLARSAMVAPETIRPDMTLESLGMGSLEQVECVMAIEEELRVELPLADLRRLQTVSDVIDAVRDAAGDAGKR